MNDFSINISSIYDKFSLEIINYILSKIYISLKKYIKFVMENVEF